MSELRTFDAESFGAEVLGSDRPVLVEFWAEWCGPCKALLPVLKDVALAFRGRAVVGRLDIEAHRGPAQDHGIRSVPTLLLFKEGQVVSQIVGAVPRARIEEALQRALSQALSSGARGAACPPAAPARTG